MTPLDQLAAEVRHTEQRHHLNAYYWHWDGYDLWVIL